MIRHIICIFMNMNRTQKITALFCLLAVASVHPLQAAPPQAKFFPLNREADQQGVKPAPKYFPINKGKPMKLVFSPSKKIYANDKQAKPIDKKIDTAPANISDGNASQLLSIYESVD